MQAKPTPERRFVDDSMRREAIIRGMAMSTFRSRAELRGWFVILVVVSLAACGGQSASAPGVGGGTGAASGASSANDGGSSGAGGQSGATAEGAEGGPSGTDDSS